MYIMDEARKTWLGLFFRYAVVGTIAFAVDFLLLYCGTKYGRLHYLWAAAFGFLGGSVLNYILSIKWVFTRHTLKSLHAEFAAFTLIGILGLGINEVIIWALAGIWGMYYLYAKLCSAGIVFLWNFLCRKIFLFH